jgi:hypothetical protein
MLVSRLKSLSELAIRPPVIVTIENRILMVPLIVSGYVRFQCNRWKGTDLAEASPIDHRRSSGRAKFVAMMQPTNLGKYHILAC